MLFRLKSNRRGLCKVASLKKTDRNIWCHFKEDLLYSMDLYVYCLTVLYLQFRLCVQLVRSDLSHVLVECFASTLHYDVSNFPRSVCCPKPIKKIWKKFFSSNFLLLFQYLIFEAFEFEWAALIFNTDSYCLNFLLLKLRFIYFSETLEKSWWHFIISDTIQLLNLIQFLDISFFNWFLFWHLVFKNIRVSKTLRTLAPILNC